MSGGKGGLMSVSIHYKIPRNLKPSSDDGGVVRTLHNRVLSILGPQLTITFIIDSSVDHFLD